MGDVDDSFKDGVRQITLPSWQDFNRTILTFNAHPGYVWRGQKQDWSLISSFDRKVITHGHGDRARKLKAHLDRFKKRMKNSFPNVLPANDLDVWALGQHYGLMTPLIDWSLSPYVAAYFAFAEAVEPNDTYRYVYGLSRSLRRLMTKQKKASTLLSTERAVPFIDQLPYPSPRFIAQKGVFTKAFRGNDIKKYILNFAQKRPGEEIVLKIRIPTKDRDECLQQLKMMNIDHATLLLDFSELVDGCNNETLA